MERDLKHKLPAHRNSILASICLLALCAFLWPAMVTFDAGDWPSPNQYPHHWPAVNACGVVGAWCAYQLRYWIGDGGYPLLLFMTLAAIGRLIRGRIGSPWERALGLSLVVACTSASAHLISDPSVGPLPVGHGGVVGYAIGHVLGQHLDRLGTLIVLITSMCVGLIFTTEGWVLELPGKVFRRTGPVGAPGASPVTGPRACARGSPAGTDQENRPEEEEEVRIRRIAPAIEVDIEAAKVRPDRRASVARTKAKNAKKPASLPIVRFPSPRREAATAPYPRQIENWRLPSPALLHEPEYGMNAQHEQRVRKQAQVLEQTLREFRLDARVVEIDTGPVITMFELKLGAGIKVSQIAALSNDIARALRAPAIRVVAPISGKNTVGIEVPNTEKEKVRLSELMTLAGKKASQMRLPLFLGKDAGGAALVTDLTTLPHLLIAGTTGSGKSVCLNAIVISLMMTKRPDHVKLILIDPKMVEMSHFKDVPHLMCPIVTDRVQGEKILEWAVTKMDERYELFAEARVKSIEAYNSLGPNGRYARLSVGSKQTRARTATHLPYIVIVIDELADLMVTAASGLEHHLSRLAQKSRAVGVHIIVATQRPEVKIVTGLIKSNLPSRICFRVASRLDSRIVLDQNGGEALLGQGDMLFLPPGSHKLIRAQGTFLEEAEVRAVLEDLTSRAQPEFHPDLLRLCVAETEGESEGRDPLFEQAVRVVLNSRRGSVSLLQRRLGVGYARASRLIEQMAEADIVGSYKGSRAREVFMTLEQWEALQAQTTAPP